MPHAGCPACLGRAAWMHATVATRNTAVATRRNLPTGVPGRWSCGTGAACRDRARLGVAAWHCRPAGAYHLREYLLPDTSRLLA